jgi:alpha-tubulin suppressor-like RCC1 family protein
MGMDNVNGNVFFISNPVTGTTSGDRDVFNIKDDGNVYISHLDVNSLTAVDPTFTSVTLGELPVTGTITASSIVGGSPLTLSSDSNVKVNTKLSLSSSLQVGDTINVGGDGRTVTIKEISGGVAHTVLVDTEGVLWGTGAKEYFGLAEPYTTTQIPTETTFTQIPTEELVANVACGFYHTMIIDINGTVSGTGYNIFGQLGVGDTFKRWTFTSASVTASQIAGGNNHTMIIADNTVWGAGRNNDGQLGIGTNTDTNVFTSASVTASQIAGGNNHTMIIANNTVSGTGRNNYGQLGLGDTTNRNVFTSTSVTASKVASTGYHTMIIANNTVSGTGRNNYGQLGLGDTTDRNVFTSTSVTASQIACGYNHTMIIGTNETVLGTGQNNNGQLGLGDTTNRNVFTSTSVTASQIACGYDHTMIIGTNETGSGTGWNNFGQLGLGDTTNRNVFTSASINRGINLIPDPPTIHVGNFRIGYLNDKLNLGLPGYYTTIDATGNMSVTGYVSKSPGGTFNIPHPLPSMKDSHRLVHSFIEGPKADLIYRGESTLTNGSVSINIDQVSNMTQGTFQALTRDVQLFITNESSWDSVKGSVDGNIITIESENPESNASASWIVVAERNDRMFIESNLTNDDGVFIVEKQNIDN